MAELSDSSLPNDWEASVEAAPHAVHKRRRTLRILLAEKIHLIAADLGYELKKQGIEVEAITDSQAEALRMIGGQHLDLALLNIELCDGVSYPVAQKLGQFGIPFAFFTTYSRDEIADGFKDVPRLQKPQDTRKIARQVLELAARVVPYLQTTA